jgi:hypothetical protein
MRNTLSVNEALDQLDRLNGEPVCVYGILHFEFEHIDLWHYAKAERRDAEPFGWTTSSMRQILTSAAADISPPAPLKYWSAPLIAFRTAQLDRSKKSPSRVSKVVRLA